MLLLLSWSIQLIRFLIHFPIDFTKLVNFNTSISLSVFQLMTRIVLSIFCSALVLVVLGKMAYALLYNPALILQPKPAWQVKKCFSCSQKRFEWAHTSSSHLQPEPLLSKIPRSVQLMGGTTTVWNHYWSSQWSFCIRATLPYYSLVQACLGILVCLLHYEGGGRDW